MRPVVDRWGGSPVLVTTAPVQRETYPCLDPVTHRYRSFPCSKCRASGCIFGKKPVSKVRVELGPGRKACEECGAPYQAYGKSKYCSDACRKKAMYARRKRRRVGSGNVLR